MKIMMFCLGLAALSWSAVGSAQDKIPVTFDFSGDDPVGKSFEVQFKSALSASASYSPSRVADIRISLLSLDANVVSSSAASAAAISFTVTVKNKNTYDNKNPQTWYPLQVAHGLRIVEISRKAEVATELLAYIDDHLGRFFDDCKLKTGCL
jgi:hypothetical protein